MKVKKLLELAAGKRLPMLACNEYLSEVGLCSANYLTREVDKSLSGGELKRIENREPCLRRIPIWPSMMNQKQASIFGASIASRKRSKAALTNRRMANPSSSSPTRSASSNWQTRSSACVRARSSRKAAWKRSFPNSDFLPKENDYCSFTEPPDLHLTEDLHQLLGATMAVDLSPIDADLLKNAHRRSRHSCGRL